VNTTVFSDLSGHLIILTIVLMLHLSPPAHTQPLPQSGIADVNGTQLYYEMAGEGQALSLIQGGAVDSRTGDYTLDYPERVKALILVSSNLGVHVPGYNAIFDRTTVGRQSGGRATTEVWGKDPHQGQQREFARPRVLQIIEDNVARFRYLDNYRPVEQLLEFLGNL